MSISIYSDKFIDSQTQCFIIAEAGSNFRISNEPEINFNHALKLIDIAVDAGADAVKFQLYRAEKLYVKDAGFAEYLGTKKSIYEIIKEMELPTSWLVELKRICEKKNIIFLCTPFDETSVDVLEDIGIQAYKIASYSINHIPLLKHIARTKKPVILSTGASTVKEIQIAIDAIYDEQNFQVALMQCTAKYPAPLENINLNTIPSLKKQFSLPVGLSDHSRDNLIAPLGAVALGANIIEKHFTTDNELPGPDHKFAVLPHELKDMISKIRQMEKTLGSSEKVILKEEKELHSFARRSIYARKDIKKGEIIQEDQIVILRSGKGKKGFEPAWKNRVIGKTAKKNIIKQEPISRYNVLL